MAFRKKKEEKVEEVVTSDTEVKEVATDGRLAPPAAIQLNGSLPQDRHIVING